MREQIKQDIDLIEILFYLKKKIRVIGDAANLLI